MNKIANYINQNFSFRDEYFKIFGHSLPFGKCFCPFHHNVNTPSAKLYGNVLHCFSCNKNYTVYDLLKKFNSGVIDDVKSSVVVTAEDFTGSNKFKIVPITGLSIKQSLDKVLSVNGLV